MSEQEAVELVEKLIQLSIARDGSSGGLVRIMVLKRGGVKESTVYPNKAPAKVLPGFAKASKM